MTEKPAAALPLVGRPALRTVNREVSHALEKLADWFETVNQKFTNTTSGRQPPSYAELYEDAQQGLCQVGYLLELVHQFGLFINAEHRPGADDLEAVIGTQETLVKNTDAGATLGHGIDLKSESSRSENLNESIEGARVDRERLSEGDRTFQCQCGRMNTAPAWLLANPSRTLPKYRCECGQFTYFWTPPPVGEPGIAARPHPDLPDVELVSAKVHEAWMAAKAAVGVTSRKAEDGEELIAPYAQLSERAKDLDRLTVKAVYAAIAELAAAGGIVPDSKTSVNENDDQARGDSQ